MSWLVRRLAITTVEFSSAWILMYGSSIISLLLYAPFTGDLSLRKTLPENGTNNKESGKVCSSSLLARTSIVHVSGGKVGRGAAMAAQRPDWARQSRIGCSAWQGSGILPRPCPNQ